MNGIEKDLRGKASVVRLNLLSKLGRDVATSYGIGAVPAMLVFDGTGEVTYRREGIPERKRVLETVAALTR